MGIVARASMEEHAAKRARIEPRESAIERQMRMHIKFLADDELKGRRPGTSGEAIAASFIANQMETLGLTPGGDDGTFFQQVKLVGLTVDRPSSKLGFAVGDYQLTGKLGDDYVHSTDLKPGDECSGLIDGAELLFVGHGVDAPHLEWDDFKGVDVVGKVLLVLVNHPSDPPFPDDDMLYYGRWTYKFEEARRRGAVGCLLIHHSDEDAGYPWSVAAIGCSGEKITLEAPEEHPLQLHGWLNRGLADKLA